ncbi:MAG: copper resistance protein CopC/CopD [Actinobacteria bacterium]|nr:copper resistance protein CopC/CopD [Actinomycetota bacterium]
MPAAHPHAPTVTVGRASRRLGGVVRAAFAVAVLAVLVLGPAAPASAHAQLTASDPTDGAVLDVAPAQVTLRFSEGVTVQPDGVRVLDRDATRVDGGVAEAQGSVVVAPVDQPLPPGGYVVAWRVVSADGHPVHGAFSFSVGTRTEVSDDVVANAFAGSADGRDELLGAILRAVAYVAILASAGAVWMGAALRRDDEPTPVGRVVTGLSAVGLLAVVLQVPVQASLATGQGLGAIGQEGVLGIALADGVGWSIAISGIGLIALLVTAGLPFRSNVRLLALAGAALAPLGLVVTGHTRTMSPAVVGYLADAAHVAAGAVWIGGLGALLAVVRRRRADDDVAGAARALATFSGWAGAVVAVVVAAGLALTWLEVGSLRALTSTTYGRYLMAKVAVALAVVAGAAWNRFRLVPAIVADADADADAEADEEDEDAALDAARRWRVLQRVVRLEVVGLVVVLGLTAQLANTTPARTSVVPGVQSASAPLGSGTLEVLVDPARPGRNDVHAYLLDSKGRPDDRFDSAEMELAVPAEDVGPLVRTPVRAGPGHFILVGTDLELAGDWTLTVIVKPDRFTEQRATVGFRVG